MINAPLSHGASERSARQVTRWSGRGHRWLRPGCWWSVHHGLARKRALATVSFMPW